MTIRKRLTPALSTLLFLLVAVACQVVAIKIFPYVVGSPLVGEADLVVLTDNGKTDSATVTVSTPTPTPTG